MVFECINVSYHVNTEWTSINYFQNWKNQLHDKKIKNKSYCQMTFKLIWNDITKFRSGLQLIIGKQQTFNSFYKTKKNDSYRWIKNN